MRLDNYLNVSIGFSLLYRLQWRVEFDCSELWVFEIIKDTFSLGESSL
jgi:hypothetical protein